MKRFLRALCVAGFVGALLASVIAYGEESPARNQSALSAFLQGL